MEWVMKMSRFQISEEEYEAIKEAEKGTNDKNVSRRLRVLMLRYEGYKVRELAKIFGMRGSRAWKSSCATSTLHIGEH